MKNKLNKFVDDILNINDQFLYDTYGHRPDLQLFLNSNIHYFDNFNKKMEIISPFLEKDDYEGDTIILSGKILEFMDNLKIKDYLGRFNSAKSKMHFWIADMFDVDDHDLMYFLFLSFGDYLYDELNISKDELKSVYVYFLTYVKPSNINLDDDVIHDIELYISEFKKCGLNLYDYHDLTSEIISKEMNPATDPKQILYNRLYTNFCICVASKRSSIKKIDKDDQLIYFINMMLFGVFFDDIEDIQEDISNGTPTYVSWLYQNNEYDVFVKKLNQIMAYIYYVNLDTLKKYKHEYPDKIVLLDLLKIIVLTNFDKSVDELKKYIPSK